MTTKNKKQNAPAGEGASVVTKSHGDNEQKDYTPLEWFFQQGARFVRVAAWNAKVKSPGKQPIDTAWQAKPITLKEILPHVKSGGNVGVLCGKPSGGLCLLDVDDHLQDFLEYFPGLVDAPIIQRKNAPNRGKLIFKITGSIPANKKWHNVHLEFLGTGNQGVFYGIHPGGAPYELHHANKPALDFDSVSLMRICQLWSELQDDSILPTPITAKTSNDGRGSLSRQTRDFIEYGAGPGTRNDRLFKAACDLNGCKYSQAEAESMLLHVSISSGLKKAEALATIKSAFSQARTPAKPNAFDYQSKSKQSPAPLALVDDSDEAETINADLQSVKRYDILKGAFHAIEYKDIKGADPVLITRALCNFTARVIEEIAKDDGQEITRQLKIKGQLASGYRLHEIEVNAADFSGMKWIMQKWGLSAIIHAGQSNADKLREAIQWSSQDAISRTEYTHTGWREIEGKRVYLTTAGAIGLENVTVSLEGNLKRYALPVAIAEKDLRESVQKSLQLLEIAPRSVTWALWGSMYLAPLADIAPIDFVLWVFGETGSLKSTLAALFLNHYGEFSYKTLPEGWASTDNALEKSIFTIKDAPIVIDDFAPQSSGIEAQSYEKRAARIIRAIGNHSPRTRMNADTSLREGYPSRGLVISTAEQLPSGQSILARILPVEVMRESVNKDLLTLAQKEAGYLSQAMTGYILWLVKNWDAIRKTHKERIVKLRDDMRGDYHLRTPEMFANLLLGIQMGLTYATENGAISKADASAMLKNAKAEIKTLAESQSEHVMDELPSQRFINTLEALIARGEYYLTDQLGNSDSIGKTWLGWFDDDYIYIQSESAYNAVAEFLRREGAPPILKPKSLYSMIERQGFIMPRNTKGNNVAYYKNKPFRVLCFYRNKLTFLGEKVTPPSGKV